MVALSECSVSFLYLFLWSYAHVENLSESLFTGAGVFCGAGASQDEVAPILRVPEDDVDILHVANMVVLECAKPASDLFAQGGVVRVGRQARKCAVDIQLCNRVRRAVVQRRALLLVQVEGGDCRVEGAAFLLCGAADGEQADDAACRHDNDHRGAQCACQKVKPTSPKRAVQLPTHALTSPNRGLASSFC